MNRTQNVIRNLRWGIIQSIAGILMPFFVRTVLIWSLSAYYAGLDGLFTSVLSVLSLAELGVSNAITYGMYSPVSQGDERKICALMNLYRKAYRIIGCIILILGLLMLPFLRYLIHGNVPEDINIYILFVIYLFKTVISYFLYGYKTCVLAVNQRKDVLSKISICSNVLLQTGQCVLLLCCRNYYMYIVLVPFFTILENLLNSYWAGKLYPTFIPKGSLEKKEFDDLKKRVAGLIIWKLGGATRNTLDSIAVSMFLGLVTVAIYNNYWMVINGVVGLLSVISSSMIASVGNKIAVDTSESNYKDFHKFQFLYMWIVGWCTICMMCLYQPFMKQWMGVERMLPFGNMLLFCYLFFMLKKGDINSIYYQAAGLWWEGRWRSVIEAVSNLILNFVLGFFFGIAGILLATIISYTIAYFYGSKFTFLCYFKNDKLKTFYLENVLYLVITCFGGVCTYKLIEWVIPSISVDVLRSLVALLMCMIVPNVIFFLVSSTRRQNREYIKYGICSLKRMIGRNN